MLKLIALHRPGCGCLKTRHCLVHRCKLDLRKHLDISLKALKTEYVIMPLELDMWLNIIASAPLICGTSTRRIAPLPTRSLSRLSTIFTRRASSSVWASVTTNRTYSSHPSSPQILTILQVGGRGDRQHLQDQRLHSAHCIPRHLQRHSQVLVGFDSA